MVWVEEEVLSCVGVKIGEIGGCDKEVVFGRIDIWEVQDEEMGNQVLEGWVGIGEDVF